MRSPSLAKVRTILKTTFKITFDNGKPRNIARFLISEIEQNSTLSFSSYFHKAAAGQMIRANISQTMIASSSIDCSGHCTMIARGTCGSCVGYMFRKDERLCELYKQTDYDMIMPEGFILLRKLIL